MEGMVSASASGFGKNLPGKLCSNNETRKNRLDPKPMSNDRRQIDGTPTGVLSGGFSDPGGVAPLNPRLLDLMPPASLGRRYGRNYPGFFILHHPISQYPLSVVAGGSGIPDSER